MRSTSRPGDRASTARWLCGILCLISALPALYFAVLYAVAASYAGGMGDPLVLVIAFSALAYPAVALAVVVIAALTFRNTTRFNWGIYLVPVAYLVGIAILIFLSDGAYL